jgi:hypothetical protein
MKWREIYDSNKLIQQKQTFTITAAGLERRSDTETSSYRWSDFFGFEETSDSFYIYTAKNQCFCLPKRCVENDNQLVIFRQRFQTVQPLKTEQPKWLLLPLIFLGAFAVILLLLIILSRIG